MASTLKVRELLGRVSTLLLDADPQFNAWPEADLVNWLNDGQLAIAKYFPAGAGRVDSIRLKPGTLQSIDTIAADHCKQEDGTNPSGPIYGLELFGLVCNMGSDGLTPGLAIGEPVDRRLLDSQNPNWHMQTGMVVYDYAQDPRTPQHFLVCPAVPSTGQVWVRVSYAARPAKVPDGGAPGSEKYLSGGSDATLLSIADECADDLANYIVARAHLTNSKFADLTKYQTFASLFTGSINARVMALTGYNPNLQRLPFAPSPIAEAQ